MLLLSKKVTYTNVDRVQTIWFKHAISHSHITWCQKLAHGKQISSIFGEFYLLEVLCFLISMWLCQYVFSS